MVDMKSFDVLSEAFGAAIKLIPCVIVIDGINDLQCGMDQDIGSIKGCTFFCNCSRYYLFPMQ